MCRTTKKSCPAYSKIMFSDPRNRLKILPERLNHALVTGDIINCRERPNFRFYQNMSCLNSKYRFFRPRNRLKPLSKLWNIPLSCFGKPWRFPVLLHHQPPGALQGDHIDVKQYGWHNVWCRWNTHPPVLFCLLCNQQIIILLHMEIILNIIFFK